MTPRKRSTEPAVAADVAADDLEQAELEACTHEHEGVSHPRPPLDDQLVERAANLLSALGDPGRLRLLERLHETEFCVSELAELLEEQMSTISQRLRLLRSVGLVARRREGKHIYYRLDDAHVSEMIDNALAHAAEHA